MFIVIICSNYVCVDTNTNNLAKKKCSTIILLQWKPLNVITDNIIIAAVLKQGVKTFFRVAKCFLRVVKVFQDCAITLDLIYGKVAF
jgi:hypothetical protein